MPASSTLPCSHGDATQANWLSDADAPEASIDLTYEQRFSAAHCSTLSIPGYVALEKLPIPSDGTSVTSATILDFGASYKVRVSGVLKNGGEQADADYVAIDGDNPSDTCANTIDFGVAIDSGAGSKKTTWGSLCASHAYTTDVVGAGAPLALKLNDCSYADNAGQFLVEILAPKIGCTSSSVGGPNQTGSVVLYSNNFETPNVPLTINCGGSLDSRGINTLYGTPSFTFAQTNTVEGVVLHDTQAKYQDPSGRGGKYAVGMLSTVQNDLLALTFDNPHKGYLTVGFDLSSIDVTGCGGPFGTKAPLMQVSLYDTPAGNINVGAPGTLLDRGTVRGVNAADSWTFAWHYGVANMKAALASNPRVTIVFDLLESGYAAFDNLSIVAGASAGIVDKNNNGVPDDQECVAP